MITLQIGGSRNPTHPNLTVQICLYTTEIVGHARQPVRVYDYTWSEGKPYPDLSIPLRGFFEGQNFDIGIFSHPVPDGIGPEYQVQLADNMWERYLNRLRNSYIEHFRRTAA